MYKIQDIDVSTFLRDDPTFQRIIQGFYGINHLDFAILSSLYQLRKADAKQIVSYLENSWPKNKINAALKKIHDLGLVKRKKEKIVGKHSRFVYTPIEFGEIKDQIIRTVENWLTLTKIELENLDQHILTYDVTQYSEMKKKRDRIREEWFD